MPGPTESGKIVERSVEAELALTCERWLRFEQTGQAYIHEDIKAWAESLSEPLTKEHSNK